MKFSIVTPSYNQGHYLAETIESVLSQEGNFDLDYIVIDGESQDDSVSVIKYYENLLNEKRWVVKCRELKFRWVSEKDYGQTDAIMKGFRLADGEILAWLNSDDIYLPGALNQVMEHFTSHSSASIIYGKTHFTDEAGQIIGKYPTMPFDEKIFPAFNFICQPSVFFKKSAMAAVSGLNIRLNYVMDYDFWIRLSKDFSFFYVDDFFSTYRLHEESKTISHEAALANHYEALQTVFNHYGWAPLNRVYSYCFHKLKAEYSTLNRSLLIGMALGLTMFKYLSLNRGIRIADVKLINRKNLRKLSMNLIDIYKEY